GTILRNDATVSTEIQMGLERYGRTPNERSRGWFSLDKRLTEQRFQTRERIAGVDGAPQLRAALNTFREVGGQCTDFIDDPAVVGQGARLVDPLVLEQLDVVEEEAAAIGGRNLARGAPGHHVFRLRQDPRVAQDAAADEHPFDAQAQPLDDVRRLR